MSTLPHNGLGGYRLGLPTPRPTTPRVQAGLERVRECQKRLWKKWEGEGKGGRSGQGGERVKMIEQRPYLWAENQVQCKGAYQEHGHQPLPSRTMESSNPDYMCLINQATSKVRSTITCRNSVAQDQKCGRSRP